MKFEKYAKDIIEGIGVKDEFETKVEENNYMGNFGWVEKSYIAPTNGELFKDIIKKYEGKKIKIIIQELD